MDFLGDFIEAMRAAGCAPANPGEVIADDKKRRYQLVDEGPRKKTGSYQIRIDGTFAVGWFRSFKEGKTHKWNSKSRRDFTPEEKAEWKARVDEARSAQAQRIRGEQKAAAAKAERIWEKASKTGSTEYLERKRVSLGGARVYRGTICVPIRIEGKLSSLQFIAPSGEKRFVTGSELIGGYFSFVNKGDDLSTILVCEGFATGGTLREATGLPVVVGFGAGNLKPVALALRKKYPEARLVFCADNDQWTKKPDGTPWNPGIDYAKQAAAAIGGAVVIAPQVPSDDEKKRTDFNDVALTEGFEVVKTRITVALAQRENAQPEHGVEGTDFSSSENVQPPLGATNSDEYDMPPEPPLEAYSEVLPSVRSLAPNHDWRELLLVNEEGKLKSSSLRNAILFLKFHKDFEKIFAYNEFHQNIMLVGCPPWDRQEKFAAKRLDDISITNCSAELEKYCINVGTDKAFKAIQSVAHEKRFHPAREYFNSLVWDKKPRLEHWLSYYLGCESEAPEYLGFVGTKWLVAAVRRVFRPGCKFDHVLVIEGEQGRGKSTLLKLLATFGKEKEESYFTDAVTIADIQNKDTIMKIQGSIIVELSELSGFSKKDDEEIKRWITLQHDDARLPYAREMSRFDRQFVLSATTNKQDYLKDPTGNRRYWPVLGGGLFDLEALKADREQLWAEAVQYHRDGMYIGPTEQEERWADIEREKRLAQDAWTETVLYQARELKIERALTSEAGFKVYDVMAKMGLPLRDRDEKAQRRITTILQMNSFENVSKWNPETKRTERFWMQKERK